MNEVKKRTRDRRRQGKDRRTDDVSRFSAVSLHAYEPLSQLINGRKYAGRITEVSINGPGDVWVVIAGEGYVRLPREEAAFATETYFTSLCRFMAANIGLSFDPAIPVLACRTPDGHRFHAVTGPMIASGMAISVRVKRMHNATWEDFHVKPAWAERIQTAVEAGKAILISGATGSGKTTFQNMILQYVPLRKRLIVIEDTQEIEAEHPNKVSILLSRNEIGSAYGWRNAIDDCLRLNPDVIIPGELSITNAFPVLQAMDTGHEAVMTTMHANSPKDALRGFRRRVALSGAAVTEVTELLDFLADTIELVIQIKHEVDDAGERRVVTDVLSAKEIVAAWDVDADDLGAAGDRSLLSAEEQTLMTAAGREDSKGEGETA